MLFNNKDHSWQCFLGVLQMKFQTLPVMGSGLHNLQVQFKTVCVLEPNMSFTGSTVMT